eukprot:6662681-Prymnesium_polylepis.1
MAQSQLKMLSPQVRTWVGHNARIWLRPHRRRGLKLRRRVRKQIETRSATITRACSASSPMTSTPPSPDRNVVAWLSGVGVPSFSASRLAHSRDAYIMGTPTGQITSIPIASKRVLEYSSDSHEREMSAVR